MENQKPNLLVICSDQHHHMMSGYRDHPHVKTPNLDRMAKGGTYFTNAYCNSPLCTPSRMSFITGKYVNQINVPSNMFPLSREEMTWPRRLDQAGIPATMLGKMDFCGDYQDGGFTDYKILRKRRQYEDLEGNPPIKKNPMHMRMSGAKRSWRPVSRALAHACPRTDVIIDGVGGEKDDFIGNYDHDRIVTDWAVEYLKEKGNSKKQDPWALYVGLLFPHEPYTVPAKYFDMYYPNDFEMPLDYNVPNYNLHPAIEFYQNTCEGDIPVTEDMIRRTLAAYYGMITCMDDMIGEVIQELENQGCLDNTIIMYTSDHGEQLGEHGLFFKSTPYQGSVAVPLILNGPGIPKGNSIDHPVSLIDMYPTVMDIYGLEAEDDRPGSSLLPLVKGNASGRLDYAFAEFHAACFKDAWYMIVKDGFKYVWFSNSEDIILFNMNKDPFEMNDLSNDASYKSKILELDNILRRVVNPEEDSYKFKKILGLISSEGYDLTKKE